MRCATCGTENAPDSRFCGGCGARQATGQRVAPTAKIDPDAAFGGPTPVASGARPAASGGGGAYAPAGTSGAKPAASGPVSYAPPSLPPRVAAPPPPAPTASGSIAKPQRGRGGVIVLVLLVDLGLAIAGGVLLSKGLAARNATQAQKKEATP